MTAGVLGLAAGVPGLATAADILTSFFNVQTADENVFETLFRFFSLSPFNEILDGVFRCRQSLRSVKVTYIKKEF